MPSIVHLVEDLERKRKEEENATIHPSSENSFSISDKGNYLTRQLDNDTSITKSLTLGNDSEDVNINNNNSDNNCDDGNDNN